MHKRRSRPLDRSARPFGIGCSDCGWRRVSTFAVVLNIRSSLVVALRLVLRLSIARVSEFLLLRAVLSFVVSFCLFRVNFALGSKSEHSFVILMARLFGAVSLLS